MSKNFKNSYKGIILKYTSYMTLSPIISELSNVALGKPANQSTTDHDGFASRAVDGVKNSDFYANSCTHTKHGLANAWWLVDLKNVALVYKVKVLNRNRYADRLRDFNILVGKSLDSFDLCEYFAGPSEAGKEYTFKCRRPRTGRYVKIQKVNDTSALQLCEVEVMGISGNLNSLGVFTYVPGKRGTSNQTLSYNVKNKMQCAVLCLIDKHCLAFNLVDGTNSLACKLLEKTFTEIGNNGTTIKFYH